VDPLESNRSRRGRNETRFRELNEALEYESLRERDAGAAFEIVCECAREECSEMIEITFIAYEAVRAQPTLFVLVHDHLDTELEQLVSRTDGYDVVGKIGDAALVAFIEDPRG
jgi:hypothetical protein